MLVFVGHVKMVQPSGLQTQPVLSWKPSLKAIIHTLNQAWFIYTKLTLWQFKLLSINKAKFEQVFIASG